jgi:hypothetical protein
MAIRIGDVTDRGAAAERRRNDDSDDDEGDEELGSLAASSVAVRGRVNGQCSPSSTSNRLERHASMACMWHTTVPQSLTPLSECGLQKAKSMRHAPTRRSLRHSRMLVSTKSAGCFNGKILSVTRCNARPPPGFRRAITSTSIFSGVDRVGPALVSRHGGDDDSHSLDDVASIGGGGGLTCLVASQMTVGVALIATFAAFAARNPFWADVQAANLSGALVLPKSPDMIIITTTELLSGLPVELCEHPIGPPAATLRRPVRVKLPAPPLPLVLHRARLPPLAHRLALLPLLIRSAHVPPLQVHT